MTVAVAEQDQGQSGEPAAAPESKSFIQPPAAAPGAPPAAAPGASDVPEYLAGGLAQKFWDAEKKQVRVDALAKSYAHLESRLGAFKGAPPVGEDGKVRYELRLPEGVEGLDPKELAEDPFWQGIQEDFAAANVSQELADKLAARYFTTMAKENMVNRS